VVVNPKNPWGQLGGLEAQRSDLWVIDMSNVLRWMRLNYPRLTPLPQAPEYFARQILFPEDRINAEVIQRNSIPYQMPGYDTPLGEVRVDFIHDTAVANQAVVAPAQIGSTKFGISPGVQKSQIFTMLSFWKELARVGRGGRSLSALSVPLPDTIGELNQLSGFFQFQFDVDVVLLRGLHYDPMFDTGTSDVSIKELEITCSYRLVRCWCAAIQLATLNQTQGNEVYTVTASLYPEDIVQVDLDALRAEATIAASQQFIQARIRATNGLA
jgi:hypothetical protein